MTIDGLVCKNDIYYIYTLFISRTSSIGLFSGFPTLSTIIAHNYNLELTLSERSLNTFIHMSEFNISIRREEAPVIVIVFGSPRGCTSESSIGCSVGGSDPLLEEGGGDGSDDVAATRVSTGVE